MTIFQFFPNSSEADTEAPESTKSPTSAASSEQKSKSKSISMSKSKGSDDEKKAAKKKAKKLDPLLNKAQYYQWFGPHHALVSFYISFYFLLGYAI